LLRGLVQWERYWVPLGVKIATEAAGFLCDPKGFGQPNKKSFRVLSELWDLPFVVLCGEPASGKSTLVEIQTELFSKGPEKFRQLLMIDFRTILDAAGFREQLDRSQIWRDWRSAQYPLHIVIDGVDEGLFKLGDFLPQILFHS
jgi:hypothetical protein